MYWVHDCGAPGAPCKHANMVLMMNCPLAYCMVSVAMVSSVAANRCAWLGNIQYHMCFRCVAYCSEHAQSSPKCDAVTGRAWPVDDCNMLKLVPSAC